MIKNHSYSFYMSPKGVIKKGMPDNKNKTLYIIKDFEQKLSNLTDSNATIYAWDYFSSEILSKNFIKHKICDQILDAVEMNIIDLKALELATTWYDNEEIKKELLVDNINLGFLIEWEFFHYLIQTIKNFFIIEKIIREEKPSKIVSYGDIGPIKPICMKYQISYEPRNYPSFNNKFILDSIEVKYDILNHPIAFRISFKKFFLIKKVYERIISVILKIIIRERKEQNKKSFLLLEFNPSTYSDFLNVASLNGINVKLLNFRRPAIWNLNSLKAVKQARCEILNLDTSKVSINIESKTKKILSNLQRLFSKDEIFEKIFSVENKSFWFYIKDEFKSFCKTRFSQAIEEIESTLFLFENQKIDCILAWNDSLQTEKTIMTIGKRNGIPTIALQHGLVAHNDNPEKIRSHIRITGLLPLVSDYLAAWGKIMQEYAIKIGMKKENVIIVGSPRYDNFFKKRRNVDKKTKTILFATSGLGNNSVAGFTSDVLERYEKSIEIVCTTVQKLGGYELIVKLHPYSTEFIDIKKIIKKINPSIKIIQNANLVNLIENCDVLITYGQSTVLLEAMILEKPTISIWLYDFASPQDEVIFRYDAISVIKHEELENTLKLLLNDTAFAHAKVENGKKLVNDYLSHQGSASQELLKFLQNLRCK